MISDMFLMKVNNDNKIIEAQNYYELSSEKINLFEHDSKVILEDEDLSCEMHNKTLFSVVKDTAIDIVRGENKTCCVLDYASYKDAGGLVEEGVNSQEESLCYPSNLHSILKEHQLDFYCKHIAEGMNYGFYSDESIFVNNVTLFRDSEFSLTTPKPFNVIVTAAPYAKIIKRYRPYLAKIINKFLFYRCKRVLEIAKYYKQDVIVLGPFGCGVFGNNVEILIRIWKYLLNNDFKNVFKKVIFSVPNFNGAEDEEKYELFRKKFES